MLINVCGYRQVQLRVTFLESGSEIADAPKDLPSNCPYLSVATDIFCKILIINGHISYMSFIPHLFWVSRFISPFLNSSYKYCFLLSYCSCQLHISQNISSFYFYFTAQLKILLSHEGFADSLNPLSSLRWALNALMHSTHKKAFDHT